MTSESLSSRTLSTSKLKFYSLLLPNEKIETNPLAVASTGFFNTIYRTFTWSSNRNDNLRDIKETVNNVLDNISKDLDLKINKLEVEYRLADINKLITSGLPNLSKTYENDRFFKCDISNLIESINLRLFKIYQDHQEIKVLLDPLNIKFDTPFEKVRVNIIGKDDIKKKERDEIVKKE